MEIDLFKGKLSNNMVNPNGKSHANDVVSFLTTQRWVSF